MKIKSDIEEALAAWQKCNISDDQLNLLIKNTKTVIEFLSAFGENGILLFGLRHYLISFEEVKTLRKQKIGVF